MSCEVYWDAVPLRKRQNARLHMHLCTKVMGSSGVTIMIYHTRVQYLVYVGVQVCKPLTPNMKDTPPEPLQQRLFGARLFFLFLMRHWIRMTVSRAVPSILCCLFLHLSQHILDSDSGEQVY